MSLHSAPFWWVKCDVCGVSAQENSDFAAWANRRLALGMAIDSDWNIQGGNHVCYDCQLPLPDEDGAR